MTFDFQDEQNSWTITPYRTGSGSDRHSPYMTFDFQDEQNSWTITPYRTGSGSDRTHLTGHSTSGTIKIHEPSLLTEPGAVATVITLHDIRALKFSVSLTTVIKRAL